MRRFFFFQCPTCRGWAKPQHQQGRGEACHMGGALGRGERVTQFPLLPTQHS